MSPLSLSSFKSAFYGDIIMPDSPEYSSAISRWAVNAERSARVVAKVRNMRDVSLAIKYATENQLPLAIRGGGHNSGGGSSAENGLVIDLGYLNSVKIDSAKLGYVGGGALWKDVDEAAIARGLATVGGTINHTGVGGLTLGGGIGWLSGEHGLAVDNLAGATIVIADGRVITANESQNSDLFWGIRGSGSNFGVCTEFVFRLHPQRRTIWAGFLVYPSSAIGQVLAATKKWWERGPSAKERVQTAITRSLDAVEAQIMVNVFFNGTESEGRSVFKQFIDLGPTMDTTSEMPYENLNALVNEEFAPGHCRLMRGFLQDAIDLKITQRVIALVNKITENNPEFTIHATYEYTPSAKIDSVPKFATPFPRHQSLSNGFLALKWNHNTSENLDYAKHSAQEILDTIAGGQQSESTGNLSAVNMAYGNFEHDAQNIEHQDHRVTSKLTSEILFGENYPRLQRIKRKYDPENLFCKWFAITPAPSPRLSKL